MEGRLYRGFACPPTYRSTPSSFTVGLEPDGHNGFAISVCYEIGPAGLMATVLADYSDNTTETLVTDDTCKAMNAVSPGGWTNPSYNDSGWTPAVPRRIHREHILEVVYSAPCHERVRYPPERPSPSMGNLLWRTRTLYVNGKNLSNGSGWTKLQAYSILNLNPNMNVIAVDGANPASNDVIYLAANMLVACNDDTPAVHSTDGFWKTMNGVVSSSPFDGLWVIIAPDSTGNGAEMPGG
ncbi:hypothetical protein EDD18DRAFT_1357936 [Armillaria luteobubalina]|uniref:Uncharacterized protein n=1 Tax=Armillaria luteobubalina TaxID=153913 RepID=A0AA39PZ23_9AGAR|nr:hypothetical protein EDD18DRAFT_1357936 [Armillaria luteobubalina]